MAPPLQAACLCEPVLPEAAALPGRRPQTQLAGARGGYPECPVSRPLPGRPADCSAGCQRLAEGWVSGSAPDPEPVLIALLWGPGAGPSLGGRMLCGGERALRRKRGTSST